MSKNKSENAWEVKTGNALESESGNAIESKSESRKFNLSLKWMWIQEWICIKRWRWSTWRQLAPLIDTLIDSRWLDSFLNPFLWIKLLYGYQKYEYEILKV